MSIDKAALLAKYASNLPDSPYRRQYEAYARDFLDYADNLDKETVNGYIAKLRRERKAPGT